MISVEVLKNGSVVYQTSSARQIYDSLFVTRLDPGDPSRVADIGPHFAIQISRDAVWHALEGKPAEVSAFGKSSLGNVAFVSGAAAREGTDSCDIASVTASWTTANDEVRINVSVELGESLIETQRGNPIERSGEVYWIAAAIPFVDLPDFFMLNSHEVKARLVDVLSKECRHK